MAEELEICLDCAQTEMIFALLLAEIPIGLHFQPTRLKTSLLPPVGAGSALCTDTVAKGSPGALLLRRIPYLMLSALRLGVNTPGIGYSTLRMPPQSGMWSRAAWDALIQSRR